MTHLDPDRVTTLTFDCYGTLIDWEAGTVDALRPLLALRPLRPLLALAALAHLVRPECLADLGRSR